jgi:hypothetical protein
MRSPVRYGTCLLLRPEYSCVQAYSRPYRYSGLSRQQVLVYSYSRTAASPLHPKFTMLRTIQLAVGIAAAAATPIYTNNITAVEFASPPYGEPVSATTLCLHL